jgi:hypothetical protein
MPSDQPYPSPDDPIVRAVSSNDIPANTRHNVGGDVWFDVVDPFDLDTAWDILNANSESIAWDILNVFLQTVAWDILTENNQDTSWDIPSAFSQDVAWSIFPEVLFFIAQLYVKPISLNFKTQDGDTVEEQYNLITPFTIKNAVPFTFSIKEPTKFTFGIATVLSGESRTTNKG